jgi:hypothetical protein
LRDVVEDGALVRRLDAVAEGQCGV